MVLSLSLLVALLLVLARYREEVSTKEEQWEKTLHEHLALWDRPRGRLRPINEVSPFELGVSKPVELERTTAEQRLGYVHRIEDEDLDRAIDQNRFVLLKGESKAGKSRAAYEACRRLFPDRLILIPLKRESIEVILEIKPEVDLARAVLWLDSLERYVDPAGESGLTIHRLQELMERGVLVLATIRNSKHEELALGADIAAPVQALFERAKTIVIEPLKDTKAVRQVFDKAGSEFFRGVDRYGLGAFLVAGPRLADRFDNATNPYGVAIVRAAIDWRRVGLTRPIPEIDLKSLHPVYLPKTLDVSETAYTEGLEWAQDPIDPSPTAPALLTLVTRSPSRSFEAFDYIEDYVAKQETPVPDEMWMMVLDLVGPEEQFAVSISAYSLSREEGSEEVRDAYLRAAESASRRLAEAGSSPAANNLGVLLAERGDVAAAKAWYQRAAEASHVGAAVNLGALLAEQGDIDQAIEWYRRAAETGRRKAAHDLGVLLAKRGDLEEAETWYRRAAEAGDPRAANNLGLLLVERGEEMEGEHWYRRAAEAGNSKAANNLGTLLSKRGDNKAAEEWYRRAADAGDQSAMNNLGLLLFERGQEKEAEAWYRRGAEAGDIGAANNLGILLLERGDLKEAEIWYRRVVEAGHPKGSYNLGRLFATQGKWSKAKEWYRRAAEAGHISAAHNLGVVLYEAGDKEHAMEWFRRAAEAGHRKSAQNLGVLLAELGDIVEAEIWYRRAAEAGDTWAAFKLGVLLAERGDQGEAEHWYRRAAEAGYSRAAYKLGSLLAERGDENEAEEWFSRAKLGDQLIVKDSFFPD